MHYAYNNAIITKSTVGNTDNKEGLTKENAPKNSSGSWIKYSFNEGVIKGLGLAIGHSQVSKEKHLLELYNFLLMLFIMLRLIIK